MLIKSKLVVVLQRLDGNKVGLWDRFTSLGKAHAPQYDLTPYKPALDKINQIGEQLRTETDEELVAIGKDLRNQVAKSVDIKPLLHESFALTREVAFRKLGMRHYDVQILAGLGMAEGKLVEMQTGEGKTLAAVLPAAFYGLRGEGVHILTFNDYLAKRDAEWMRPVYEFLGLSVGSIQEGMSLDDRKAAYLSDVTYATAKEAGFDFLRMHLVREKTDRVQRPFNYAIVDEADSILIDEARVPLVIAGEKASSEADPYAIAGLIATFEKQVDWETDEHDRHVLLTDQGIDKVESFFSCGDLHADKNYLLLTEVNQALHARVLLHRDKDYIVRDGRIEIVDEFTGRVVDDRRWPDGLQEALEAKEGLAIQPGGRILGSIAMQNFVRQYPKLAGMTATAVAGAEELGDFYGLDVLVIPRNKPTNRSDLPLRIYRDAAAKQAALVDEIALHHAQGRPILVGTSSVRESEELATLLASAGMKCQVLNAKNDEAEAAIIAQAGLPGTLTISTNMAGRGTDIKLGGSDEKYRDQVLASGGLYVIGTNLHESKRIDDQLRGRAGRQGDPGSSQFFASLEDPLMTTFGIDELIPESVMPALSDEAIELPLIRNEVARIQRISEGQNYEIRKTLRRYSQMVEAQRKKLMAWREEVLQGQAELMLFATHDQDKFAHVVSKWGDKIAYQVEQEITLHYIDECWSDHLLTITQIREGIHLVGIGGKEPLNEFHKQIADAFWLLLEEIEVQVINKLKTVRITATGIDADEAGIKGPSSTWTYLINDRALNDLQQLLFGHGSAAFGVGVIMTWPLLLVWGIWMRIKQRRKSRSS